jgi:uncharacterized protein
MNKELLAVLVCPRCHKHLEYRHTEKLLICPAEQLAYEIVDHIPILLAEAAKPI